MPAAGSWLVRDGRPACVVVDAGGGATRRLAAAELRSHLQAAFGAEVPLVEGASTDRLPPRITRLVVGAVDTAAFEAEEYLVRSQAGRIDLAGRDQGELFGAAHDIVGHSSPGTLYAVYDFLDRHLGARWLWPGEQGTFVPRHRDLTVPDFELRTRPDLEQRLINVPQRFLAHPGSLTPGQREQVERDTILWGYRHRMGKRTDLRFVHSFAHWWDAYHVDHPEYFAQPPPGRSQPFPQPRRVKLCVSQPGVEERIVAEWRQAGRPASWCVGPNDGAGWCTCVACRALDGAPDQDPEDIWFHRGVCLTGRYTDLWNRLLRRMRRERSDVRLTCYAYSAYRETRPDTRLEDGMVLAVVNGYDDRAAARWQRWAVAGAGLFLRPNWFHMGGCYPHLPLQRAGAWFRFARAHAMRGYWFDSLLGYWSTQGPFYYLIARLGARPDLTPAQVVDEYCSTFGAAAPAIRRYLAYWEERTEALAVPVPAGGALSQDAEGEHERACRRLGIDTHPLQASWRILSEVAHDGVLAPARDLLSEARRQTEDGAVLARIRFLGDGLDHLARLRDLIETAESGAGQRTEAIRELAAWQDGATLRHVIWGPLLRHTLTRRGIHLDGVSGEVESSAGI